MPGCSKPARAYGCFEGGRLRGVFAFSGGAGLGRPWVLLPYSGVHCSGWLPKSGLYISYNLAKHPRFKSGPHGWCKMYACQCGFNLVTNESEHLLMGLSCFVLCEMPVCVHYLTFNWIVVLHWFLGVLHPFWISIFQQSRLKNTFFFCSSLWLISWFLLIWLLINDLNSEILEFTNIFPRMCIAFFKRNSKIQIIEKSSSILLIHNHHLSTIYWILYSFFTELSLQL